jgi:hypothetical protein
MKRLWTLLGVVAVLIALAQGISPQPAEATFEGCSSTFCQRCAGECCPTSTGGCKCLVSCPGDLR